MDMQKMLHYLSELEAHNERSWYHAHKAEKEEATAEFLALVQAFLFALGQEDERLLALRPKDLLFRIPRDTRYHRGEAPYNAAFRAHLAVGGKPPIPVGDILVLRPGDGSFLGGGLYADGLRDATGRIRDAICANGEEWESILHAPAFAKFYTLLGTALKNVPRGYDRDAPQAESLKNKSFYLQARMPDKLLLDGAAFWDFSLEAFAAAAPFNAFLNRALEGFVMPAEC